MALTYRTGSDGKGSALTIEELDNNFRHFTGSHDVSGSFTVSGSANIIGDAKVTGSFTVSGSNTFENIGLAVFKSVPGDTTFGLLPAINVSGSINTSGSITHNLSIFSLPNIPSSDPGIAGRVWRDGTDLKISIG